MNIQHTIQTAFRRVAFTVLLGVFALLCLSLSVYTTHAALDVPQILTYQGRLTDDSRITVDDATITMKFAIYDASSGGNCLWSAGDNDANSATIDCTSNTPDLGISVPVVDGMFTVLLGDTTASMNALPDTLFDNNSTLYLGVTISTDSEMTPLRRIGSAAFAIQAGNADLLDNLNTVNSGCTTACVPVTTSAGNLVLTGDPQSTLVSGGTLYINPATAGAGEALFGIADNGTTRFLVDTEGDTTIKGHLGISGSASSANSVLNFGTTYMVAVAGNLNGAISDLTFEGDLSTDTAIGIESDITVSDTVATDRLSAVRSFYANDQYSGDGTTGSWTSFYGALNVSNGTVTDAQGVDATVTADGGIITTGRAVRGTLAQTSGTLSTGYGGAFSTSGTIATSYGVYGDASATATSNYGGYFKATNGSKDYAIYTAEGLVHIEGDSVATSPNTSTTDGELYVFGDIENDGNIDTNGHLALVGDTPSTTSIISATETFTGASEYRGLDLDITAESAQAHSGVRVDIGINGALNSGGRVNGVASVVNVDVDSGASNDAQEINQFNGSTSYLGTGLTDAISGFKSAISLDATGDATTVYGVNSSVTTTNAGAAITSAYGGYFSLVAGTGSIGKAFALYAKASGATTNFAAYTSNGQVWIEGDDTPTTATFNDVATHADGTLFVQGDTEIFDGSLCVGDGGAGASSPGGNCANAAGTDGVIYSVNTSVTQHDVAEMFPSSQFLTAGEIVSVSSTNTEFVERTVGKKIVIGAISTSPGLTLGWETAQDNYYPVALTGRTPIKVNGEGGAIAIGDRIAMSSVAGIGKKATEASEIVGIAMQAFNGKGQGAIVSFVQPHYWDGIDHTSVAEKKPEPKINTSAVLVIEGNAMSNIASLKGYNWSVDMNGVFATEGSYQVLIRGNDAHKTTTYSTLSSQQFVTLAGTTKISGMMTEISFAKVDPAFANTIQADAPIVVTATMSNGSGNVWIREKSTNGFQIWRDGGSGDEVDWIVMAYRNGVVPEKVEEPAEEPVVAPAEDSAPVVENDPIDAVDETSASDAEEVAIEPVDMKPIKVVEPVVDESDPVDTSVLEPEVDTTTDDTETVEETDASIEVVVDPVDVVPIETLPVEPKTVTETLTENL
ncbi:hypothetical protein COV06_02125 [Candidatus Uhrbacteria bacterium CG10_big_fil_rev_8_21_14_0_10_50_16]|uniref:Uncharacterized protein n=1 Tax=Candidatus Uhrbacteria bacterium CG10_big_fil_rev_8_21_14_0_10_50_16 TaxID=1975039 RepID=A0A2H0RMJ0_9BACT|nr:MAG: hypothetical protein COV06_02125 [Candidatus Uhrbacteria bacterium CG10_big_fil_rev_8_21_14_0_10_50_16]